MKSLKRNMLINVRDYAGILLGSIIFGIAYSWFLIPFKVAPGGVGGIAEVIYDKDKYPLSHASLNDDN